jgi:Family of unknown function (DUF6174)
VAAGGVIVGSMANRTVLLLTVVLAASAAFALPAAAQQPLPAPTPDPTIADGSAQHALDTARARWKALRIRSYDYEVRTSCFCMPMGWIAIKVRNDVPAKRSAARASDLATIPRLFRQIQQAISDKAHKLTVTYGARGVPVEIYTDPIQYAADDESGVSIRRFKRR